MYINLKRFVLVLLAYILVVIGFGIILSSCNPSKNIQKTLDASDKIEKLKDKFEQEKQAIASKAIEDYVKNNPLIYAPVEVNLDSLCPPCQDAATNGTSTDYQPATYAPQVKIITNTKPGKVILQPYEDVRKIKLLNDSLLAYKLINASLNTALAVNNAAYTATVKEKDAEIKQAKLYKWLFFGLLGILVLLIILAIKNFNPLRKK